MPGHCECYKCAVTEVNKEEMHFLKAAIWIATVSTALKDETKIKFKVSELEQRQDCLFFYIQRGENDTDSWPALGAFTGCKVTL